VRSLVAAINPRCQQPVEVVQLFLGVLNDLLVLLLLQAKHLVDEGGLLHDLLVLVVDFEGVEGKQVHIVGVSL